MNSKQDAEILNIDFECTSCQKNRQNSSKIPVKIIIEKLDRCFQSNDLTGAKKLLDYWQNEANLIGDYSGELSVVNEQLGLTRKMSLKAEGEAAINRALELIDKLQIGDSVSGATIIINAATTSKAFDNPEAAVPLYERALAVYKKELSPDDLRNAALFNNFATTLVDLERYIEAEALYDRAIEITSKSDKGLLDSAVSYVNKAHLYEKKDGELSEEIEISLQKAEEILEDSRIKHDGYYAFVCEKCAPSFDYFGFFVSAKKYYERAKKIYEGN